MELEITSRSENAFLNRTEIRFRIKYEKEPGISREKVREKLAASLSVPKELVIINKLHSEFGKPEISGYVKVYRTKEDAMANERKHILIRNKLIEPEKKEAKEKKAPPPKKEEAKKEEPKPDEKKAAKPAEGEKKEGDKKAGDKKDDKPAADAKAKAESKPAADAKGKADAKPADKGEKAAKPAAK
jgi:ribosomal protein S24E